MTRDERGRSALRFIGVALALTAASALFVVAPGALADGSSPERGHFARERVLPEIRKVMEQSRYRFGRWGLLVQDLDSGRVLQQLSPDQFLLPASGTKSFTMSAAIETWGVERRFVTPVHGSGDIGADGTLNGDLIMVGVGDLTLGGRDNPDGTVAFVSLDHTNANGIDGAQLTAPDPLGGFDRLAEQIASAGISRVTGDVIVDDRLFDTVVPRPETIVSPIIVNDNLIDLMTTPGAPGQEASVEWRPRSAAFDVDADVETVAAGEPTDIEISGSVEDGLIIVRGQIAADKGPLLRVHPVTEPARFARTLLIEALVRSGVAVDAPLVGENPVEALPTEEAVADLPEMASLVSAAFSEYLKLIQKVSHNLGAELTAMLIAVANGENTIEAGLGFIGETTAHLGVDPDAIVLGSASGLDVNRTTPRAVVDLLRGVSMRSGFNAFFDALPVLGVDGSLETIQQDSPAAGHVNAKTGTGINADFANARLFLSTETLAGYIDSAGGRRLVFSLFTDDVLLNEREDPIFGDVLEIKNDLGEIATILWQRF
jgi:D-alanyl-D-alanine carboxypeptidase/D-alanyl-D-alanine-endopeptidase (penicillin-binding protein 4)